MQCNPRGSRQMQSQSGRLLLSPRAGSYSESRPGPQADLEWHPLRWQGAKAGSNWLKRFSHSSHETFNFIKKGHILLTIKANLYFLTPRQRSIQSFSLSSRQFCRAGTGGLTSDVRRTRLRKKGCVISPRLYREMLHQDFNLHNSRSFT